MFHVHSISVKILHSGHTKSVVTSIMFMLLLGAT